MARIATLSATALAAGFVVDVLDAVKAATSILTHQDSAG